ncbi:MAG: HDIG domain-containing metalloprotein [Thermodesulfobacteriota bacterium]
MNVVKRLLRGAEAKPQPAAAKGGKPAKGPSRPAAPAAAFHLWPLPAWLLYAAVLVFLALLAGLDLTPRPRVFLKGEVAGQDVTADVDFMVEDSEATRLRRLQVVEAQPPVFDLSPEAYNRLEEGVYQVFAKANTAGSDLEKLRWSIGEDLNTEVSTSTLQAWRQEEFQNMVLGRVLPWLRDRLAQGVAADAASLRSFANGIMVRDLASGLESLRVDLAAVQDMERLRHDLEDFLRGELKKPLPVRRTIAVLTNPLLTPSLSLNLEESKVRKVRAAQTVEPAYIRVKRGEIIVREGEAVTQEQQLKLQALMTRSPEHFKPGRSVSLLVLCGLLSLALPLAARARLHAPLSGRDVALLSVLILTFGLLAKFLAQVEAPLSRGLGLKVEDMFPFSLPLAGFAGVVGLFFPHAVGVTAGLILSLLGVQFLGGGVGLFAFHFISAMLYVYVVKQAQSRTDLMKTVFPLAAAMVLAWVGVGATQVQGVALMAAGAAYALAGAFMSLLVVLALSPIVELLFGYTSRFKLMELMSLEQPLLQQLMVAAPGTYHHSLILSNMVEAGARAIGANHLLARVAALYHDIGKLRNPQYFIENQGGRENKHDKLAPSMSALILISHVKKGVELAREHKLGREIEDLIGQHHGATLISYFFHKAEEQARAKGEEPPREAEYRYPGPKPQTKEAGLLLIADAIEASSRVLVEPSPSRLKGHIETIVKKIFADGQLDESELTLKDLHLLSEAFLRILTGIFHQRIEYPGGKSDKAKPARPGGEDGAQAQAAAEAGARQADRGQVLTFPRSRGEG